MKSFIAILLVLSFLITDYEYLRSRPRGRPGIFRILPKGKD
mgnify:CR=1